MRKKSYDSKSLRSRDKKETPSNNYKTLKFSLAFPRLERRRESDLLKYNIETERELKQKTTKISPLIDLINKNNYNPEVIKDLKKICWTGTPKEIRPAVWKILFKLHELGEKRFLYETLLSKLNKNSQEIEKQSQPAFFKQVKLDIPRTWILNRESARPSLISKEKLQNMLSNILRVFILHNPHIGYIQGINEIAAFIITSIIPLENLEEKTEEKLWELEVSSYWCFYNLLEDIDCLFCVDESKGCIPDFIEKLKYIVKTIDLDFFENLENKDVDFLHFSFRWISCLYIREFPKRFVERFWDVFLCESNNSFYEGFVDFSLYLSAAILLQFKETLEEKDFQECVLFLQKLSSENWTEEEIEMLLSKAYLYKSIYEGSVKFKKK